LEFFYVFITCKMHINILLPTSLNKTLKYDEEPTQDMFEFDISQGAQC